MCFAGVRGKSGIRSWRLADRNERRCVMRKLTEEQRREMEIYSLALELRDDDCDEEVPDGVVPEEYLRMAAETLYGKEGRDGAR